MCLTCGCMDAHLEMGQHNITFEDIKAAAEENGKTVAETFEIFDETLERDRTDHPDEYSATACVPPTVRVSVRGPLPLAAEA